MRRGIAWRGSNESWSARCRRCFLLRLCRFLPALRRLGPELLREPLDPAFRVDELLPAGEERVAIRADFEVQLLLGRPGLPSIAAGASSLDVVVLRVDTWLHNTTPCGNFDYSWSRRIPAPCPNGES